MTDFIIVGILSILIGFAIIYIGKQKKKGVTCIGCPSNGICPHANQPDSPCNNSKE